MFRPCSEVLGHVVPNVRYELGVEDGSEISVYFDSMISKIVVWSHDRKSAIRKIIHVLQNTICLGITTNQVFLQKILSHPAFQDLDYTTSFIDQNKRELMNLVDTHDWSASSAVVASLVCRNFEKDNTILTERPFRTIPARFRNQRKDLTRFHASFVACDLKSMGQADTTGFIVSNEEHGSYRVWPLPDDLPSTPKELKGYFNKTGGPLVKRYYSMRKGNGVPVMENVRILHSTLYADRSLLNGSLHVQIGGKTDRYWVARGSYDEHQTTVFIQCPEHGIMGSYAVSGRLSWAGKLADRANGTFASGKYLSLS